MIWFAVQGTGPPPLIGDTPRNRLIDPRGKVKNGEAAWWAR
jgi:hypothetical protein